MKKVVLIAVFFSLISSIQAQKIATESVPEVVKMACMKAHPTAKDVKWRIAGLNYESKYILNNKEQMTTFDSSGKLVQNKTKVMVTSLLPSITKYVKDNYKSEKILKAYQVFDAANVVTYVTEVKGMYLTFDAKGNFLKASKD